MSRPLSALALALVLGSPSLLGQTPKQLQPFRAAQARSQLLAQRAQWGLGERDGLAARSVFTSAEGRTVIRLEHTYDGHRVWGSQAVAHVEPDGRVRALTKGLRGGIALDGAPRLRAEEAGAIARRHLGASAPSRVAVERVVFPTRFLGGLESRLDPATGRPVLDRRRVVHAKSSAPYVWAYEVRTGRQDTPEGPVELTYLIDGTTGAILRMANGLHADAVPSGGTGTGLYRGPVNLATSRMNDGTFALFDTTRGLLANPGLSWVAPDASGWSPTGLQIWYDQHDGAGNSTYSTFLFQSNPANTWGDGQAFTDWGNENGANGQTAGVDAMSAMSLTWDMYRHVFGREGLDGQGTSTMAYVLMTSPWYRDNAWWSIGEHGMYLGAGSYPANPAGFQSMTDLDVVAHEMSHGLTSPNWSQYWVNAAGYEEAGLDEATSDFFAQMAKAYAGRGAGAPDDAIPASGADWQIGAGVGRGTPIRRMDQPSLDQRSRDGWHDGIQYMDGHYSSGPINRALYFLAQGAPNSASVFLPAGMTGLGNDKAAHIWFKAVTERLIGDGTGSLTFADAREAALAAAQDLHGAGSPETIAVENAFAAANIGDAHGQPSHPLVRFADWRNGDWIETNRFTHYANRQVFPKGETVAPIVSVEHAANTSVTWSLGGPSMFNGAEYSVSEGGTLNADGTWTTPNVMGWHAITATSQADPHQLAEGRVFLIDMDMDQDLEQDALDMAGIAFSWYLTNGLNPAHSVFEAPWVDDADVAFFADAMKAAWPAK